MSPYRFFSVVKTRRASLKRHFDVVRQFETIEESCVPSYAHSNLAAALVAWARLASAAALYQQHAPDGPVLDFGAATGEIRHMLQTKKNFAYDFIESSDILANALIKDIPDATRKSSVEHGRYAAIFALDSLEHNDDYTELLNTLANGLHPNGVLILSGPTESWLYRFGRWIAGFSGHYHKTTIFDIEHAAKKILVCKESRVIPISAVPLFRVTLWTRRQT